MWWNGYDYVYTLTSDTSDPRLHLWIYNFTLHPRLLILTNLCLHSGISSIPFSSLWNAELQTVIHNTRRIRYSIVVNMLVCVPSINGWRRSLYWTGDTGERRSHSLYPRCDRERERIPVPRDSIDDVDEERKSCSEKVQELRQKRRPKCRCCCEKRKRAVRTTTT